MDQSTETEDSSITEISIKVSKRAVKFYFLVFFKDSFEIPYRSGTVSGFRLKSQGCKSEKKTNKCSIL